jgi:hypothetical protein
MRKVLMLLLLSVILFTSCNRETTNSYKGNGNSTSDNALFSVQARTGAFTGQIGNSMEYSSDGWSFEIWNDATNVYIDFKFSDLYVCASGCASGANCTNYTVPDVKVQINDRKGKKVKEVKLENSAITSATKRFTYSISDLMSLSGNKMVTINLNGVFKLFKKCGTSSPNSLGDLKLIEEATQEYTIQSSSTTSGGGGGSITPPSGCGCGSVCYESPTNSFVSCKSRWTYDSVAQTITIRTSLSKPFVDNTYGTNTIGWSNGHTFSNLTGSDHLQLALYDGANVKKMEFKMDYLTASTAADAPSGYKSLGVIGGEGRMLLGSATDVVDVTTSLDENFNTYGYVLTTNSPATNSLYAPNPSYPNWIYDVWYQCTIKLSAFGSAGFGIPLISWIHASPSKTGNNTEVCVPVDCPNNCPTVNVISIDKTSFCSGGGSVNGSVLLAGEGDRAPADDITVTWTLDGINYTGSNPVIPIPANNTCSPITKNIHVKVVCNSNQSILAERDFTILIKPVLSATITTDQNDCSGLINLTCPDNMTEISWTYGTSSGSGPGFNLAGQPENLNYTLTSSGCSFSATEPNVWCPPLIKRNNNSSKD